MISPGQDAANRIRIATRLPLADAEGPHTRPSRKSLPARNQAARRSVLGLKMCHVVPRRNLVNIKLCCALAGWMAFVGAVLAQERPQAQSAPPANPITSSDKGLYSFVSGAVIAAAQKMPEEGYS